MKVDQEEKVPPDQVHSLAKVTWLASIWSGFLTGKSGSHCRGTKETSQQWIDENEGHDIPLHLADLTKRAQVDLSTLDTPQGRKKKHKGNPATPTTTDGAREGTLYRLWFVLTRVWPDQGSRQGLTLGKKRVKMRNEKFGGTVTTPISGLTDALVVGDFPGEKKILEAYKQFLKIIIIDQLNDLILEDLILEDLTSADYPSLVSAVLDTKKTQVQRHPQLSVQHEQAQEGTAGESISGH